MIKEQKHKLKRLHAKRSDKIGFLSRTLSYLDFALFCKLLIRNLNPYLEQVRNTQDKKLHKLWLAQTLAVPGNTVRNYSSLELTKDYYDILKTGLCHPTLPPNKVDIFIQTQTEGILHHLGPKVNHNHIQSISYSLHEFHNQVQKLNKSPVQKKFLKTVRELKKRDDVRICRFDKGRGVAILNTTDYIKKLQTIVDDGSKFKVVNQNSSDLMCNHAVISNQRRMVELIKKR